MAPKKSPLNSMTGFGSAEGQVGGDLWRWELKSVNGRGLDLRCRLGPGLDGLEPVIRKRAASQLKRGNISISLTLDRARTDTRLVINQDVLDQVVAAAGDLATRLETSPPSVDGLLALRGVMEVAEPEADPVQAKKLEAGLLSGFDAALEDLKAARRQEGAALAAVLADLIGTIEQLTTNAETEVDSLADVLMAKFKAQIADLTSDVAALDPERLHQEVAILLTKADIREELDRLKTHGAAARDFLKTEGPVGRKLDFLTQEFNREANTLCSKAASTTLTAIGLEMKASVDQLREQVQNVE